MRPPGGVSFADGQMNRGAPAANFSNRQHENGRSQIVHQQKSKSGNAVANGFGKNRQKTAGHSFVANGTEFAQPNGRGDGEVQHPNQHQQQHRCGCCPYGFHIDLGFVKFAEDVAAGKEQIQNWSSPEKKRTRLLLNSPSSSDRTMLDVSQTSDRGGTSANDYIGILSPQLNESSPGKSVEEEDELQELQHHFPGQMLPSVRVHHAKVRHSQQNGPSGQGENFNGMPTSILKNNGTTHWADGAASAEGFSRAKLAEHRSQQQKPAQIYRNHQQQQQHQSRFFQQQCPGGGRLAVPSSSSAPTPPIGRRRFSLSVASTTPADTQQNVPMPSLRLGGIGSPLRTSTPRIANEETHQTFARPSSAYHPSSASSVITGERRDFGAAPNRQKLDETPNGSGANSAPTSPEPRNYHTAIAQRMAQMRKGSSSARPNIPFAHCSLLSSLSAPARNIFSSASNVAIPSLAHGRQPTISAQQRLELGRGQHRRMLSPEPNQMPMEPPAECSLLRKSNMRSRAFFHAANGGGCAAPARVAAVGGGVGRVPYRSRQCITPTPSSAWDLGDFASVRRHRLDAFGGTDSVGTLLSASVPSSSLPPSAQFVRSLSPPPFVPFPSVSSADSPPFANSNAINGRKQKVFPFGDKTRNIGTQTLFEPSKKEIAIGTDHSNWPPKRDVKDMGTSPSQLPFPVILPCPSVAVPSVSIGVDTCDLCPMPKSVPPAPPPKPSGPKFKEEIQRRKDKEQRRAQFENLSAEFQYCLGHEPEHKPGEQPQFVGASTENGEKRNDERRTIDRGVDAFSPSEEIEKATNSMSTSTTELQAEEGKEKMPKIEKRREDAKVQTEEQTTPKSDKGIGTEAKGTRTTEAQTEGTEAEQRKRTKAEEQKRSCAQVGTQTEESAEWVEAEIGRRLAEAAAERREKRKRNSVERSTETEEKEAPDQFIMITCNKCEQRSSVAGDELFEKIVVPPEDNADEEAKEMPKWWHGQRDETEKREKETIEERRREEREKEERENAVIREGEEEEAKIGIVSRQEEKEEYEEEIQEEQEMPDPFACEGNFRGEMETILEELEEELEKEEYGKEAKSEGEEGQREEKVEHKVDEDKKREEKRTSDSPQQCQQLFDMFADGEEDEVEEGEEEELALALERRGEPMELDRISVETDAQTVICAEGADLRPDSSVSSHSNDEKANSAFAASRTEALRKLLTEPQRFAQPFQRDACSYRSYRAEKGKANDLEYITERHKSDTLREAEPTTAGGGRKALKEAIALKKTAPTQQRNDASPSPTTSSQTLFTTSHIPEPIPARIPRPKFAKYSPNSEQAETADERAEACDRLTPLRSEMRALASSLWVSSASVSPSSSACGSPRIGRALILRPQQQKDNDNEGSEDEEGSRATKDRAATEGQAEDADTAHSALLVMEDASSTSSEGARTYEMSDEERAEFEVSAPLRDALETIDAHLASGANANTKEEQAETEWAYKYCQHEWMKLTIKKNANADLVEQFIDALEAFSNRLMEKVVNMTDQNGNTALHYAVSNENFDVVSVLLDSKVCRVDEMNKAGYSALMLGALCELRNETECAIVQRLFQMGNVNAKAMKHSQTALMLAASHGRVETTSLLLSCGADVNIQDVDGSTALMCAAEHGQREIVKTLLKRPNVDASLTDCDNQTALSIAVENQHRDIGVLIYAHLNFSRLESNEQSGVSI
ncbi:hypothetical protein niasHT_007264 [Heterodera trifolii]|uniref:Uncharacterized protein n=1 Tax=Heterodera trifolii TaxID=157864 RepID=A0ABD2LLA8_9BILA